MTIRDECIESAARAICTRLEWAGVFLTDAQRELISLAAFDAIMERLEEPDSDALKAGCCIPGVSLQTGQRMWQAMINSMLSPKDGEGE